MGGNNETCASYLFVLAFARISTLEIARYLEDMKEDFKLLGESNAVAAISTSIHRKWKWMAKLGGCYKIGRVFFNVPPSRQRDDYLVDCFRNVPLGDQARKKLRWAISIYRTPGMDVQSLRDHLERELMKEMDDLGITRAKKMHLSTGGKEEIEAKRVDKRIFEVLFAGLSTGWFAANTIEVMDLERYRYRDLQRPEGDSSISMPPRLARTLVNLAGAGTGKLLLDPFCGTGTILQEGLLVGSSVKGVDADPLRVRQARKNLKWLQDYVLMSQQGQHPEVIRGDALQIDRIFEQESIDAIASEPLLIPSLKGAPSRSGAEKWLADSRRTYSRATMAMTSLLRRGGRLALVVPVIPTLDGHQLALNLDQVIADCHLMPYQPRDGQLKVRYPLKIEGLSQRRLGRALYLLQKL